MREKPLAAGFRSLVDETDDAAKKTVAAPGANAREWVGGAPLPYGTGELPISRELLFSWYDPLLAVGRTRPLEQEDIWTLPQSSSVASWALACNRARSGERQNPAWQWVDDAVEAKLRVRTPGERKSAQEGVETEGALLMLWRSPLRSMYTRCGLLRLLAEGAAMLSPLCLNQIMRYLNNFDTLIDAAGSHTRAEGAV